MKQAFIFFALTCMTALIINGCKEGEISEVNKNPIEKGKNQKIMKEIIVDDNPNAIFFWKKVIHYNYKGKIIKEITYDKGDKLKSNLEYTYNESGDIIELKEIIANQELSKKTIYEYDKNRKLINEIDYNKNGDVNSKSTYNYDAKERLISKDFVNSFTFRHEYVYDPNDKLISKIYYNSDGTQDVENFDEHGNKIGDRNNSYAYDEKNNLIEEIHDYSYGLSKFTFDYKYNDQGDWIEKKTYYSTVKTELGELRNTEKRLITYFP